MGKQRLFEDFPGVDSATWKERIMADLKGADYNKKLVWKTREGFDVQPFYTREDNEELTLTKKGTGIVPLLNRTGNSWLIRQNFHVDPSPEACNCTLKYAMKRGIDAAGFDLSPVSGPDIRYISNLLRDIDTGQLELHFMHVDDPARLVHLLKEHTINNGGDPSGVRGSMGPSPLSRLTLSGEITDNAFGTLAATMKQAVTDLPAFRMITIDAGNFQDGGSTLSQELGFGLAMANEYIDRLTQEGLSPQQVINSMLFTFSIGPNYFMEIAKLRAARWLWMTICREWGLKDDEVSMYIHSRTASWNLARYDANVNMLRTTTGAMSASLGASDMISVHPFDSTYRGENDFTSRIARNIQVILKEEAYFHKVADPAAGSYYIEQLTEKLADQAWNHFMEVEEKGGFLEAFKSGWIQDEITASAKELQASAASGKKSMVGVNKYPAFDEFLLKQESRFTEPPGENHTSTCKPVLPFRIAAAIEDLRLETEKSGKRPRVFLLKYGEPAWMTARAMFAGNFFACAGYEILNDKSFKTVEEGLKVAGKSGAEIIVLCSSDDSYAEAGPLVLEKMKGKAEIVIAGYPAQSVEMLKEHGLQHFIHSRSNLLEELQKFQRLMNSGPGEKNPG